jgi:signal transduction histidine kinase
MQLTSNDLMEKMNEIIWAMNEKNDTLEDLLFYTRAYAKEYCEENGLQCSFDIPENIPLLFVSGEVRRNVFLTVKESLHNIVKHAFASEVRILISIDKTLSLKVQDNGKGLETKKITLNGGNGLQIMQKRMGSIGGTLTINTQNGTCVEMDVPLTTQPSKGGEL